MAIDPSLLPSGPARDGMQRHAGMVGGSVVSAGLSRLVASGHRVFTPNGLLVELKPTHARVTEASVRATLAAWVDLEWLETFVPPKGTRTSYAVTQECPLVADLAAVRLETALALVGAHSCYGYRTALALHGLSEEMATKQVIVCRPRQMAPPAVPSPFVRSQRPAQTWAAWHELEISVSDRDASVLQDPAAVGITPIGVLATSPLRTLLDCWARPGCGVSDDRLMTSWRTWLTAHDSSSRSRKIYDCMKMFRKDPDQRPGRLDQFLLFLQVVDESAASSFMSEWSGMVDKR